MTDPLIIFLAYLIDRIFGEPPLRHPIILIGALISALEKHLYAPTRFRGFLLCVCVLIPIACGAFGLSCLVSIVPGWLEIILTALLASVFLATKMLHDSVKALIGAPDKRQKLSWLVSRDTDSLSESDLNKAAIETYAENLSDGVIAPLFYLALFGLLGIVLYKTVNTMDSMVGYRNDRYSRFGTCAARLDDILNYIPARITAFLIALVSFSKTALNTALRDGPKHDSPNAGWPIASMAGALGIRLGGPTPYFGKIKEKPWFGGGRAGINESDISKSLSWQKRIDAAVILFCVFFALL